MKIEKIETFLLECPIDEPFAWSMRSTDKRTSLISKITTNEGIVGWGEGGSAPSQSVIHDIFDPLLIGQNPLNINRVWHKLYHALTNRSQK